MCISIYYADAAIRLIGNKVDLHESLDLFLGITKQFWLTYLHLISFFLPFMKVMTRLDSWGLDVFRVSDLSRERPLTVTTYTIFQASI